ncbi:hypothetical protein [Mycobacterium uberis]|uniref:hypothetical protein n=1 Tax=Mycobacterium uberis TaxID=2162698 RepID=UPI000E30A379|nr:hypothetical protein [Mycobacterium uberis]
MDDSLAQLTDVGRKATTLQSGMAAGACVDAHRNRPARRGHSVRFSALAADGFAAFVHTSGLTSVYGLHHYVACSRRQRRRKPTVRPVAHPMRITCTLFLTGAAASAPSRRSWASPSRRPGRSKDTVRHLELPLAHNVEIGSIYVTLRVRAARCSTELTTRINRRR